MPHTLTTKCCVPSCGKTRLDGTILHYFPNPEKDPDRFRTWLYAIGGDILALENKTIFKYRRVCHHHFQTSFYTTSNRLCANAVPTQNLLGLYARPPRMETTGGQAAGPPPYSGSSTMSPGALRPQRPLTMEQRTLTDTLTHDRTQANDKRSDGPAKRTTNRNLMMDKDELSSSSSSGDVIPPTAPHVVAKAKWKKRKNTRRITDNTTGRSGGRPALVPGRLTATDAEPQATGSHSQSGGEQSPPQGGHLLAETVASSQGEDAVDASRPEISRGLPTVTQEAQNTTSDNIPAQRCPHPVARRSSTVRSSGGEDGGTSGDSAPSTSQSSQKRDRLDDIISPWGEHKRRRTGNTGSYARATQPHLSVAVTFNTCSDMTQQEASNIQGQIQSEIFAACLQPSAPGTLPYAPAFEGKAFLSEGALKLWCYNDKALSWLQEVVPRLKSPREGTGLTLIKQSKIPVRIRSTLFVPGYKKAVGNLQRILASQNPWYRISTWTLFKYIRVESNTPGVLLVLGVPEEQIGFILARGRKVAYSTGSIYVRFFTSEGVSDVPPLES